MQKCDILAYLSLQTEIHPCYVLNLNPHPLGPRQVSSQNTPYLLSNMAKPLVVPSRTAFPPQCLCLWHWEEASEQSCLCVVFFDYGTPPLCMQKQASNTQTHWGTASKWPGMRTLLSRTLLPWMGLASGVPVFVNWNAANRRSADTSMGSNQGI